mgnify:CR=1 FL=1
MSVTYTCMTNPITLVRDAVSAETPGDCRSLGWQAICISGLATNILFFFIWEQIIDSGHNDVVHNQFLSIKRHF